MIIGVGVRFAVSEGWRNAISNRGAGLVLALLCAIVFGGIAVADTWSVGYLSAQQSAWVAAGGDVLVVTNDDGVSAFDCERLNLAVGVKVSVGVTRQTQRAGLGNAPDANLPVLAVTAGVSRFLTQPVPLNSALVSTRTANNYGLRSATWINLHFTQLSLNSSLIDISRERSSRDGVYPLTVADLGILGEEYSSGVMLLMPASGLVDTCLVWARSGTKEDLRQILPELLPGPDTKPTVVADRLVTGQFTPDYYQEYLTRAWRWTPLPSGALIGLVWILLRWVRRSEDGIYQSLGVGRPVRLLLRMTEWAVYTTTGTIAGITIAIMVTALAIPSAPGLLWHLIRSTILGLAASVAMGAAASLLPARNPLDALKDR